MASNEVDILKRALQREKLARKQAENILERKSAELYELTKKLEESNVNLASMVKKRTSELKGVFENINDAYFVMDLNGNILKANDPVLELLEISMDDNINLNDFVAPSENEKKSIAFQKLLDEGSVNNFEIKLILKNETQKLVQINASLILDEKNIPIAAQGIVRDITNDRMNVELISQQKKELDVIIENVAVGIVLSQNGRVIRTNQAFQKFLGYSENELYNMPIVNFSYEEEFYETNRLIDEMLRGKFDQFTIEKRYKTKDRETVWAKTIISSVVNQKGEYQYEVSIIEDITILREETLVIEVLNDVAKSILGKVNTHEIAWEIVNKIANYLGSEDCVIYLIDEENKILKQVAAFGEKAKGRDINNKITINIGKGIVGSVAKTGRPELIKNTKLDSRYILDDQLRLSEIAVPIIYDGKIIGVIDSEHQEEGYYTEAQLITLTNVARLVSLQLYNAINLSKKEQAENKNLLLLEELKISNDELQEYAHVVSHDLKSPLRNINALLYWIKDENQNNLDENTLHNIRMIESTLESMEDLITGVLEYSSISNTRNDDIILDLHELVNEIINELELPRDFAIHIRSQLPKLKGDRTKFKQLFQNIILNSIKYNDKKQGEIDIDFVEKKTHYHFSIRDNGPGIEKKFHDKIFETFQTLGTNKDSSGIGLSIAKKIVDQYKGDIWVDSEINKGATFYFTIKKI